MEPIHVPRPPSQAFNKNRRVSDLIRAQTNHLKHLEEKLSPSQRQQIPQHAIVTEADAASYIAAMTRFLRTQGSSATAAPQAPATKQPIPIRPAKGMDLAAGAEQTTPAPKSKSATAGAASAKTRKSSPPSKGKKR